MLRHTKCNGKYPRLSDTCKLYLWRESLSMNLWFWILRVPFHGEANVGSFKKVAPSLTAIIFITQVGHWIRLLRCFARLHAKIHSLLTIPNTLIYMKNSCMTVFADYLVFNTRDYIQTSLIITALTTLIIMITWKIISLLTTLTTLIFNTR